MKCDICGACEAVVFIHQSNQGTRTELRLCAACAKNNGVDRLDGDVSASLSKLLSAAITAKEAEAKGAEAKRICPRCASLVSDIRKRGLVGCASCWLVLAADEGSGGEVPFRAHVGRLPSRVAARLAAEEAAARLKHQLAAALKAEDYETAARCRDRIRDLEVGGAGA